MHFKISRAKYIGHLFRPLCAKYYRGILRLYFTGMYINSMQSTINPNSTKTIEFYSKQSASLVSGLKITHKWHLSLKKWMSAERNTWLYPAHIRLFLINICSIPICLFTVGKCVGPYGSDFQIAEVCQCLEARASVAVVFGIVLSEYFGFRDRKVKRKVPSGLTHISVTTSVSSDIWVTQCPVKSIVESFTFMLFVVALSFMF